jgi:hypothetical protein
MSEPLEKAIADIKEWKEVKLGDEIIFRGSTTFTPFIRFARGNQDKTGSWNEFRLVVTKEARKDGQINLFTGEEFNYSPII